MKLPELVMTEVADDSVLAVGPGRNRLMRAIECKSKMSLIALSIGALGLTTTVCEASPSMQDQLDTMRHTMEQQQRMIEQQHRMMQEMQIQLDKQKQMATEADVLAQEVEREVREVARVSGIDLSKETDRFKDVQGTNIKIPESDTVLTVSGFIRTSFIHDMDQIESPTKFAARHIVVNKESSGEPDNRTTFTANASRFILGSTTPTEIGKLSTFFSWDFDGNTTSSDADLRLRQAWGQLDNLVFGGDVRIGQVWTTWDDLDALPETMDMQGPNGSQQKRQPLIRWACDFNDEYTLWVALEDPDYSFTNGDVESDWPDAVVSLNWHGDWGHLKPALVGRNLRGDADNGGADTAFGWGTQLAGNIKVPLLNDKDNFKFQLVYGEGIGSFNNDGGFDDAIFNGGGDLKTIESFQGFGALQHWWAAGLRSNAVFGWVDVDNRSMQDGDSLDQTLYAAANLVWSPVEKMDIGLEYLWGERKNKNDDVGTAQRVQATAKFNF